MIHPSLLLPFPSSSLTIRFPLSPSCPLLLTIQQPLPLSVPSPVRLPFSLPLAFLPLISPLCISLPRCLRYFFRLTALLRATISSPILLLLFPLPIPFLLLLPVLVLPPSVSASSLQDAGSVEGYNQGVEEVLVGEGTSSVRYKRFEGVEGVVEGDGSSSVRYKRSGAVEGVVAGDGSSYVRYRMEEETAVGTLIGNLVEDAGLRQKYPTDILNQLRFRFLADHVTQFDIGPTSGVIRCTAELDREGLCRQKDTCEMALSVVVQPVEHLSIIRVVIVIVDVNDNSPRFRDPVVHVPIIESAASGSVYVLPTATDWDSPEYGVQRYDLDQSAPFRDQRFGLRTTSKLDGSTEVLLVLEGQLDREMEAEVRLKMIAYDGGVPSRSGSIEIIVSVLDSNDNRPEFNSDTYETSIDENSVVGTVVIQVQAVDKDVGLSGDVIYRFSAHSLNTYGHLFAIRNTTGVIYVTDTIDREMSSVYRLEVIAEDRGPERRSAETNVIIVVNDLNDNSPIITTRTLNSRGLTGLGGGSTAGVGEDATPGTFVAHVTVGDPDEGDNGRVNCSINSDSFVLLQKYQAEYQIVTAVTLDRERTSRYYVTLRCQDGAPSPGGGNMGALGGARSYPGGVDMGVVGGAKSRVSETMLSIIVIDVNDNTPTFTSQTYRASVTENNIIGVSILQVTATDLDEGDNARIQYIIQTASRTASRAASSGGKHLSETNFGGTSYGGATSNRTDRNYPRGPGTNSGGTGSGGLGSLEDVGSIYFHVDQRGVISIQESVDREKFDAFRFTVLAVDQGRPVSRTGSALVIINVIDVNDEKPQFSRRVYTFNVTENQPIGSEVGHVTASDLDGESHNFITYSLISESGEEGMRERGREAEGRMSNAFEIDVLTGMIRTKRPLDREKHASHQIIVTASDPYVTTMSSTATVIIDVIDFNDHAPFFLFPAPSNNTIHISSFTPTGHVITTILAHDLDIEENGRITFSVQQDEDEIASQKNIAHGGAGDGRGIDNGEFFSVDPADGRVRVTGSLAAFDYHVVTLSLIATDNGQPAKMASAELFVVINRTITFVDSSHSALLSNDDSSDSSDRFLFLVPAVVGGVTGSCLLVAILIIVAAIIFGRGAQRRRKRRRDGVLQEREEETDGGRGEGERRGVEAGGRNDPGKPAVVETDLLSLGDMTIGSVINQSVIKTESSGNRQNGHTVYDHRNEYCVHNKIDHEQNDRGQNGQVRNCRELACFEQSDEFIQTARYGITAVKNEVHQLQASPPQRRPVTTVAGTTSPHRVSDQRLIKRLNSRPPTGGPAGGFAGSLRGEEVDTGSVYSADGSASGSDSGRGPSEEGSGGGGCGGDGGGSGGGGAGGGCKGLRIPAPPPPVRYGSFRTSASYPRLDQTTRSHPQPNPLPHEAHQHLPAINHHHLSNHLQTNQSLPRSSSHSHQPFQPTGSQEPAHILHQPKLHQLLGPIPALSQEHEFSIDEEGHCPQTRSMTRLKSDVLKAGSTNLRARCSTVQNGVHGCGRFSGGRLSSTLEEEKADVFGTPALSTSRDDGHQVVKGHTANGHVISTMLRSFSGLTTIDSSESVTRGVSSGQLAVSGVSSSPTFSCLTVMDVDKNGGYCGHWKILKAKVSGAESLQDCATREGDVVDNDEDEDDQEEEDNEDVEECYYIRMDKLEESQRRLLPPPRSVTTETHVAGYPAGGQSVTSDVLSTCDVTLSCVI